MPERRKPADGTKPKTARAKTSTAKTSTAKTGKAKTSKAKTSKAKTSKAKESNAQRGLRVPAQTTPMRPAGLVQSAETEVVRLPDPPASGLAVGPVCGAGRLIVRKTYKLYIGGAFPRSESGRSYPVTSPDGTLLAHAALASRKDVRDAVVAARSAVGRWSGATAYNRGQVLYRVAEMLEGRAEQFVAELVNNQGLDQAAAADQVARAIDRWVWYAGWPDKVSQIAGSANSVAGPYFNFSVPEPTGVVAVTAPPAASLLGLVSVVAPVIATGNTAVVVASQDYPLPAITLAEVLATSDLPGGVVNLLTGRPPELVPVLAAHKDVNAIDLSGVALEDRAALERLAAGNVKRVFAADEDWTQPPGLRRMLAFLETKTVWHPLGL
jgi:hypothetical protein